MQASTAAAAENLLSLPSSTCPPQTLIDLINSVLSVLLVSSLSVRSFVGRWQVIRLKLLSIQSSILSLAESPHWSQNQLLHTLLPSILFTLQRLSSLAEQCNLSSFTGGKLLMQSDLDSASASISNQLQDLDLLLRSGVLHQSTAIVLSQPGPGSGKEDLGFFIRDLFTRLKIGGVEFKKKALESLLRLLNEDEKCAALVAKEGNLGYLVNLLDVNSHFLIRELAVLAVSVLASSSDESRKVLFEEGGLGPLLRILETGSMILKENAVIAVEAITTDPENAWAISAYGGISVLMEACRSGSQTTQTHAVGALRNVAQVEEIKMALAEEGIVPLMLQLLLSSSNSTQERAANCIAILSSGEYFRSQIIRERGLQILTNLIQESTSSNTIEQVIRALSFLSMSDSVARVLSNSTIFIVQLSEFIRIGNIFLQHIAATLLSNLSISDGNKRSIASCMFTLVKLIESPKPAGLQETATYALVSLLSVRSNRKEFVRDEKSVTRLVQLLDPMNELVCKKYPVMVACSVLNGGSNGCRKRLLAAGAYPHLQRLAEIDVAGAKKALQKLASNRLRSIFSRTWRE